jgi:hypothetical protein
MHWGLMKMLSEINGCLHVASFGLGIVRSLGRFNSRLYVLGEGFAI